MTVAPLTATVLADADETDAGIASAINNAIARVAGLIGISAIGAFVAGDADRGHVRAERRVGRTRFTKRSCICAVLVASGGVVAGLWIQNPRRRVKAEECPAGQLVGSPRPAVAAMSLPAPPRG